MIHSKGWYIQIIFKSRSWVSKKDILSKIPKLTGTKQSSETMLIFLRTEPLAIKFNELWIKIKISSSWSFKPSSKYCLLCSGCVIWCFYEPLPGSVLRCTLTNLWYIHYIYWCFYEPLPGSVLRCTLTNLWYIQYIYCWQKMQLKHETMSCIKNLTFLLWLAKPLADHALCLGIINQNQKSLPSAPEKSYFWEGHLHAADFQEPNGERPLSAWAPSQYKDRLIYVWWFPC